MAPSCGSYRVAVVESWGGLGRLPQASGQSLRAPSQAGRSRAVHDDRALDHLDEEPPGNINGVGVAGRALQKRSVLESNLARGHRALGLLRKG